MLIRLTSQASPKGLVLVYAFPMNDVFIDEGNLQGKGVYAARDFERGEVVIRYSLAALHDDEYAVLPDDEKNVHSYSLGSDLFVQ